MTPRVKAIVRLRALERCEYCHFPEEYAELGFQIDHVVAQKHGGHGRSGNLAFACYRCNSHKGPNLAGIDPVTSRLSRLFNPRSDVWGDHFRWSGPRLAGRTAIGRTTISVLSINRPDTLHVRRLLLVEGVDIG